METLETLTARKFNVYLAPGCADIPAIQIGSYLTAAAAYNAVLDWQGRVSDPCRICVYVNEAGETRGGEYVATYGPHRPGASLSRAAALGWNY